MGFRELLSVEKIQLDPALWKLNRELVFDSPSVGTIIVPQDFITDFASVPRMPFAYWAVGGRGDEAAVVHDWLYTTRRFPREWADMIFKEGLEAMGYGSTTVSVMYAGVRAGGWVSWKNDNVPQLPHIAALIVS